MQNIASRHISRISLAGLLFLAALLCACPKREAPPMPPAEPLAAIEPGGSVTAEFPSDGQWHPSGFMARSGDILVFDLTGPSAQLGKTAVLLHIGRTIQQYVRPGVSQRVSQAGAIAFKADLSNLGPYENGTIQVKISNNSALRTP